MSTPESAILLFSCPDKRGIVAEVSHFICTYEGNILQSDQHNDHETNTFFMRVEWDISEFTVAKDKIAQAFEPIAEKFNMSWRIEFSSHRMRMAIFVSKYEHCLYDLLLRWKSGELKADIAMIISNHDKAKSIAEHFQIPFYHFPVKKESKEEVEQEQIQLLKKENIDLIVLARYMQILTSNFTSAFKNKIINIHHSFLPAFVGAKPYHQAFTRGVKIIGATSHYVTPELDQGPIIEQDVTRISHRDDIKKLIQKGKSLEQRVLSHAVQMHLEHKVHVFKNKTIVFE
ncbi:MAG: formyltetrahydrofolate deformylase [Spirochaetia bacterium]